MGEAPVLVVAATPAEAGLLTGALAPEPGDLPWPLWSGRLGARAVAVAVTGVGKVNTALCLGAFLPRLRPSAVVSVGVGGAYPGSRLAP
ncbi:MAG: futalosine hydrolase, partial [Candidatus Dadabacteria bacterium]